MSDIKFKMSDFFSEMLGTRSLVQSIKLILIVRAIDTLIRKFRATKTAVTQRACLAGAIFYYISRVASFSSVREHFMPFRAEISIGFPVESKPICGCMFAAAQFFISQRNIGADFLAA